MAELQTVSAASNWVEYAAVTSVHEGYPQPDTTDPYGDWGFALMGAPFDRQNTTFDDSRALAVYGGRNTSPPRGEYLLELALDTNGDDVDDYVMDNWEVDGVLRSPTTPIFRVEGTTLVDTGQTAVWRSSAGHWIVLDWRALGLTSVRFALYVQNTAPGSPHDWIPDSYDGGSMVTLPFPPSAPANVQAIAGDGQAMVSWSAPSYLGVPEVTGYTVTADPGGATCSSTRTSCLITGLMNALPYTFTVVANNPAGSSPESAPSGPVTPLSPIASQTPTPTPTPTTPAPPAVAPTPTPTAPVAALPSPTLSARAVAGRSKIKVDVNPDMGGKNWTFQVQRKNSHGFWTVRKSYRTQGKKETRTINLPKGTYRVWVNPGFGYEGAMSNGEVRLRK